MANSDFAYQTPEIRKESIEVIIASNDAVIDFTKDIDSTYISYLIKIHDLIPTEVTQAIPRLSFSDDAGVSFEAFASDYQWGRLRKSFTGAASEGNDGADNVIRLGSAVGGSANERMHANIEIFNPSNGNHVSCLYKINVESGSSVSAAMFGGGIFVGNANPINGFRIWMDTGNISSGTFELVGIRSGA